MVGLPSSLPAMRCDSLPLAIHTQRHKALSHPEPLHGGLGCQPAILNDRQRLDSCLPLIYSYRTCLR